MSLVVEPVTDLDALREEWTVLGERTGNVFATWEWNSLCRNRLARGRRLLAAAVRDDSGALVGILPTFVAAAAGPVRVLRLLGHGQGDRLGPICMPADRARVAGALRDALRRRPWSNALMLAEHLPAEEAWGARLYARPLQREASPVLELTTNDWDEFLAGRSANLRQQIRRRERGLVRKYDVRYRLIERESELPAALDALFSLHGTRWAGETEFAAAMHFHRAFAARALERGWLRLWLLELDGQPVAAWYGFRFGGADWYYQSGRDPRFDRDSVGFVLLTHTIRDCVEAGLERYLFLRGNEPYKFRFATTDPGLETVAVGHGAFGRAALTAVHRLPHAARRRLAGQVA